MPTYEVSDAFWRDYERLSPAQRMQFEESWRMFKEALLESEQQGCRVPPDFPRGLRIKAVAGHRGVRELTWAPDGRATWMYGTPMRFGLYHAIWRRIGSHDILRDP